MRYQTQQDFYRSKEWETFRQIVIDKRTHDDGFVYCDICGKPILKKYDLILHHKEELNDLNVLDRNISLNEDKIEIVHFKCHNKLHERFGFNKTSVNTYVKKHVYIVYGSPCSGKTTWVHEVATENDLIVDMDSLWQMISVNDRYSKPGTLRSVAFELRDKLYDIVKYRSGKWHNAYVITGGALKGDRDRLTARIGADECIFIDTDYNECIRRLINRDDMSEDIKDEWHQYIDQWFNTYQAD